MKKLLVMLLALVLCVGMMAVAASAAGSPSLSVSSVSGKAGENVSVDVTLSNNPGIAMLEFDIEYDTECLALVSMTANDAVLEDAAAKTRYIWVTSEEGNCSNNGKILTITFTIKEGATGEAAVKVTNVNCGNWAEEVLSVGTSAGKVTMTCDHVWGEWEVTEAATCAKEGTETRKCSVCGATETRAIAKADHTWGEWEVTVAADCGNDGEKTRKCSVCEKVETEVIPATGDHVWGEWEVTKEPTCTKKGEKVRTCTVCGKTETKKIDALGHHKGCPHWKDNDDVVPTGDITGVVTMGVIAMISVVAAAAYVTKRRVTK